MQADSALAQDAWAEGQGGDVVRAVPQLYSDSLGCSAGAPNLGGSHNVLTREDPWTQF